MPPSQDDGIKVLLEVIDPLVHDTLIGRFDSWHYGQYADPEPEPFHLRLRIKWQRPERAAEDKETMFTYLDTLVHEGTLAEWFEGSHGVRDRTYPDEADEYKEMWGVTYKLWESQSELTLVVQSRFRGPSLSRRGL